NAEAGRKPTRERSSRKLETGEAGRKPYRERSSRKLETGEAGRKPTRERSSRKLETGEAGRKPSCRLPRGRRPRAPRRAARGEDRVVGLPDQEDQVEEDEGDAEEPQRPVVPAAQRVVQAVDERHRVDADEVEERRAVACDDGME